MSILMSYRPSLRLLFYNPKLALPAQYQTNKLQPPPQLCLQHNSLINKKKGSAIVCSCDPGLPSNRSCPDVAREVERYTSEEEDGRGGGDGGDGGEGREGSHPHSL